MGVQNHGGLLRAWARARPQLRGRQLVFVGAGPDSYAAELRSLAAELGIGYDLIFTGGVSLAETVAFYRAADLLAYPSQNETFGCPSGGDGLRLSGGDLAGQLDAGNRGRRGYPADPASIAEALVAGVAPDRDRRRDMGLRRAGEFTWAAAADWTLDVYREVAERRRRRRA